MEQKPVEKTQEAEFDERFPAKDYKKSTFSFLATELRELVPYISVLATAQLTVNSANTLIGSLMNKALKRVDIKDSPAVQALYDHLSGNFVVWEPRIWCSVCNNQRAEFQFDGKVFCATCIVPIKTEQAKIAEEKAKVEVEKEVKPVKKKK